MLIKTYRLRLYVLYIVPLVLMVGLVVRLYWLQVVRHDFYRDFANEQHFQDHKLTPTRGKIFDANGHELAGSVILDTAYVQRMLYPDHIREGLVPDLAHAISQVLQDLPDKRGTSYDDVLNRLKGSKGSKLIARGIDDKMKLKLYEVVDSFRKDGIPHNFISFEPENKRRYSRGSLAPHVVGYTQRIESGDNKGADGVEKIYDEYLKGHAEEYVTRKSATGKPMEPADPELLESTFGSSIKLTINESIQAVTQNVLTQGVEKSMADSGVAVCYHVKTGEVLALANYPSYSLNDIGTALSSQRRNRALTDPIEPGSVMKIITFTSLFDAGKSEPFDVIDCENGYWVMPNGRIIKDSHSDGVVPVSQVFQYSSNIGTIKAARAFDHKTFHMYLTERFGFGKKTGIDLPGESSGVLRHYKDWSGLSMSSLPMGYEIQLTAIQVVAAVGAIANKGAYMRPHVVKEILDHNGTTIEKIEPEYVREVADPDSCRKVVDMMELVVENGTAKVAKLDGYRVGGKTGTTKKISPNGGGYGKGYIASFCGIAPIEDPEVCIYVYVDNPRGDKVYGGQVAAPIFREIAREAMRVLRIPEKRAAIPAQEFQKALEKVRNQIDGRTPMELLAVTNGTDEELSPDAAPELRGLSLAEAVHKAAEHGLEVQQTGSGVVVEQEPAAGETLEGTKTIKISMMSTRQSIRRRVNEIKAWSKEADDLEIAAAAPSASLLHTTMPLELRLGDNSIPVPVDIAPVSPWATIPLRPEPTVAAEPVYPDLDQFANETSVDVKANRKRWEAFEKEYKELEKQKEKDLANSRTEESEDRQPAAALTVPVPEIDGTDNLDPDQVVEPIEIQTPKRTPRPATAAEHMYNL